MAVYESGGLNYSGGYYQPYQQPSLGAPQYANQISSLEEELRKLNVPPGGFLANIQLPEVLKMTPVTYEPSRERSITQSIAAPRLLGLDLDYQRALNRSAYEPSAIRAHTLREALAGRGAGISNIMAGAASEARGQYNAERATEQQTNLANFQAALDRNKLLAEIKIKEAMAKEQQRMNLESAILGYKTAALKPMPDLGSTSLSQAQTSLQKQMETDRIAALNAMKPPTPSLKPFYNNDSSWAALLKEWGG